MKNLFSFTNGFYPSEWFALICLTLMIVSLIGFVTAGCIIKYKQKHEQKVSKRLSIIACVILVMLLANSYYLIILVTGKFGIFIGLTSLGLINKFKPNLNIFVQIILAILISLLLYSPVFTVLVLDEIVEDKERQVEQLKEDEIEQLVSKVEISKGITIEDVLLNYENTNEVYWSAHYSDYYKAWSVSAKANHKDEDYNRTNKLSVEFIYNEETNKLELEEVLVYDDNDNYEYTSYSKAESQDLFNKLIEEVK